MSKRATQRRYSAEGCGVWTKEEHQRFLDALEIFPQGPWKQVAMMVATRSVRQTMTHAQKHRQKIARHARGLHLRQKKAPGTDASAPTVGVEPVSRQPLSMPPVTPTLAPQATVVSPPMKCLEDFPLSSDFPASWATPVVRSHPPQQQPLSPLEVTQPFQDEPWCDSLWFASLFDTNTVEPLPFVDGAWTTNEVLADAIF